MSGPSAHLSWLELACHDQARTPYPLVWRQDRLVDLAAEFERIRSRVGVPIPVLSAYRTRVYNRRVGGAVGSQHCEGRALDLACPEELTWDHYVAEVQQVLSAPDCRIGGIGYYPPQPDRTVAWIHIDTRPDDDLATWMA